ncbi:MAG TPA: hypothetical protein VLM37_02860, partial [Fibrobacteraceae bacterium]|nr:hypothetical protein [Fibrobacteraceae bacterium]
STEQANTIFHVETSDGTEIFTFAPSKNYQSVAFSSPDLANGSTYAVYLEGSHTGTVEDGLYGDGTYTAGTQYTTFTISSTVTEVSSGGSSGGGGSGGGGSSGGGSGGGGGF